MKEYTMKLKYLTGIVLTLGIFVMGVYVSGGYLRVFIDPLTTVLILVIPAAIAFASWPVREIGRAFSAPLDAAADERELRMAAEFFTSMKTWIALAAFIGVMIGLISMLALYDPQQESAKLGVNLAVALLSVMQALLLIALVPYPLGQWRAAA
jgi:flagellar motor component MotA